MRLKYCSLLLLLFFIYDAKAQQNFFRGNNTYVAAPTATSPTAPNALNFSGGDDIVLGTNDTKFKLNIGTIEGWIKTSNAGSGYCGLFGKTLAYFLYLSNNTLSVYDWVAGANKSTGILLNDDKWHHVALSFNSGSSNSTFIYIDGVLRLTTTLTIQNQNEPFTIGSNNYNQPYVGNIDDVRVWNVQRTQSEIQTFMNQELLGNDSGLIAYYTFNQGIASGNNTTITTILDKTNNALNGALNGFTRNGAVSNFVEGKVPGN